MSVATDYPAVVEADLMTGLGTIVARWAYVDQLMGEFLSFLVEGNSALMYVITNNVSANTVSDWIRTLLRVQYDGEDPDVISLLTRVDELRRDRNTLVHGLWLPHVPGAAQVQTIRWERSEVIKIEIVTVRDLEHLAHEIDDVGKELASLGQRYGFAVMKVAETLGEGSRGSTNPR
jgi:hypothetical protein